MNNPASRSRASNIFSLLNLAGIPGLEVTDIDIITESLEAYKEHSVELSDAYISVSSKHLNADGAVTFNKKHFDKIDVKLYSI
jgi:predicted nucleic-acid-binding protein